MAGTAVVGGIAGAWAAPAASAAGYDFAIQPGDWATASTWQGSVSVPTNGTDAHIGGGLVVDSAEVGNNASSGLIGVESSSSSNDLTGSGTLNVSAGTLTFNGLLLVGRGDAAGTVNVSTGATLTATQGTFLGTTYGLTTSLNSGSGTLNVMGGTANLTGGLFAGTLANSNAAINLTAGTLNVNGNLGLNIANNTGTSGANGSANDVVFNQSGGTTIIGGGVFFVGSSSVGGRGIYNLTGGTLTESGGNQGFTQGDNQFACVFIGNGGGSGVVNVSGGSMVSAKTAQNFVGGSAGSTAFLNVSPDGTGGTFNGSGQSLRVAYGANAAGTVSIGAGGTVLAGNVFLGDGGPGANGKVAIGASGALTAGQLTLGNVNGSSGTFTVAASGTYTGSGTVIIGNSNGSSGTANVFGTFNVGGNNINVGPVGGTTAVLNVATTGGSGSLTAGQLNVATGSSGTNVPGSTGTANVGPGASLSLSQISETFGGGTHGTFNQTGGTITISSSANPGLLLYLGGTSTYNLSGGTLVTPSIRSSTAFGSNTAGTTATLILNGGTVQSNADSATFIDNSDGGARFTAQVGAGGATINTNGHADTVTLALAGTTGGAGLTKTGAGTLTLSAQNTYLGATNVSVGTLATSGSGTLGLGNVTVGNGSTGAVLVLGNGTSIADSATLSFGGASTINLNGANGTSETVYSLFNLTTSTAYAVPGTYTAAQLDTTFSDPTLFASASGETLTIAAPEPASLLMLGSVIGPLALGRRRRTPGKPE